MTTASAFVFQAPLWVYAGPASWYFVTVPADIGAQVKPHAPTVGFGSVRVNVTVGATRWKTSLFPDKKSGSYVLPMKADVRKKEGLVTGDEVTVFLEL